MPINPNIINEVIDVTSDKISNFYDRLYQTPIGKWIDSNLMGDSKLSDEEYYNKHGYARPLGGVGYAIGDIGGLGSLKKELEAAEKAKELQKVKQAARNKAIIESTDGINVNPRTGRIRLRRRKNTEGSGVYTKVEHTPRERKPIEATPKTELEIKVQDLWKQYNDLVGKAQRAANQGYSNAYEVIMKEADQIKEKIEFLSPPKYFRSGGKLKRR